RPRVFAGAICRDKSSLCPERREFRPRECGRRRENFPRSARAENHRARIKRLQPARVDSDFRRHDGAESTLHRGVAGSLGQPAKVMDAEQRAVAGETITAISTPAGEGAIALIRVSGEDAIQLADRIYRGREKPSEFPSHTQRLGEIVEAERMIDQVMLTVHRAPASYTGEDLVEISCHGGILVAARVLEACLHAGARMANPGEFTERAFLNGKMDMTQAEAVMDLIRAQTDLALRSAHEQLEGRLGAEITAIRAQVVEMLTHVEAAIDFPDEDIA